MKYIKSIIITTMFFFASFGYSSGEVFLPVNQPEYKFLYDLYGRHEIDGGFLENYYNVAPYSLTSKKIMSPLAALTDEPDDDHIRVFAFLSEDYRTAKDERASSYESIRGGLIARPNERVHLYANFLLDEKMYDDPDYTGKKWRGLAGEIENAFMAFSAGNMDIFLGRYSSFWGPVGQSLILSESARPMDAFSFRYRWKNIRFTYQLAKLNRLDPVDTADLFENRYFAGHRLDFRPVKNLQIGLFETILFGGPGRNFELSYLNPIMFYHAVQLNEDVDDNTFLGFDITWYINNRHKFYGQVMIDDMQADDEAIGDQEPDEIGYMLGVHTLDLFGLFDVQAEYLKITNRTYSQKLERNRYENRGSLIGHELGPDGDRVRLVVSRWLNSAQRLSLDLAYQRRGEGRYDDPWTEPWREFDGDYTEPFPTGVVEKQIKAAFRASGFIKGLIYLQTEGGFDHFENYANINGDDRTIPYLKIRISLILHTLLSID